MELQGWPQSRTAPAPAPSRTGIHGLESTGPYPATQLEPEIILGPGSQSSCLSAISSLDCTCVMRGSRLMALRMVFLATSSVTSSQQIPHLTKSLLMLLHKPLGTRSQAGLPGSHREKQQLWAVPARTGPALLRGGAFPCLLGPRQASPCTVMDPPGSAWCHLLTSARPSLFRTAGVLPTIFITSVY